MHKRYFRIILAAVLFVGLVAVGVHALNKRALAQNVIFQLTVQSNGVGVEGLELLEMHYLDSIHGNIGGAAFNQDLGNGVYQVVVDLPSNAVYWSVFMEDEGYIPVNPAAWNWEVGEIDWGAVNEAEWEVAPN